MRKIGSFAAAAGLILVGLGMWNVPSTQAFVPSAGIDPIAMMSTSTGLPVSHYDDYSLVFH
jgi:hypothetical protein